MTEAWTSRFSFQRINGKGEGEKGGKGDDTLYVSPSPFLPF